MINFNEHEEYMIDMPSRARSLSFDSDWSYVEPLQELNEDIEMI